MVNLNIGIVGLEESWVQSFYRGNLWNPSTASLVSGPITAACQMSSRTKHNSLKIKRTKRVILDSVTQGMCVTFVFVIVHFQCIWSININININLISKHKIVFDGYWCTILWNQFYPSTDFCLTMCSPNSQLIKSPKCRYRWQILL